MANTAVPKGKETEGKGIGVGSKVNTFASMKKNSMGIPAAQTPGFALGNKELSLNQLPSKARVVKSAPSNFMTGMSSYRGPGGAK